MKRSTHYHSKNVIKICIVINSMSMHNLIKYEQQQLIFSMFQYYTAVHRNTKNVNANKKQQFPIIGKIRRPALINN